VTRPPFEVASLDGLARFQDDPVTLPIRAPLGIEAFGVNAYEAPEAGEQVIEDHDETGSGAGGHEELYVVLRGHARFTVAGEDVDAPAGMFVFVRDPKTRRGAVAVEPRTTVLVVGSTRGRPFVPSPWDSWLATLPHREAGDHAAAAQVLRGALQRHPDNPTVLYNLACYEALAGQRAEALAHLARAFELEPSARRWAQDDSDLDSIRDDPGFPRPE
jgi:tetratricopeptide (TPR) repeat protein